MGDLLRCLLGMRLPHLRAGSLGRWTLRRIAVTQREEDFHRLRAALNPQREARFCPAGRYWQLDRDTTTVMSDTPDERRDCFSLVYTAAARVARGEPVTALVLGLGLGMVTKALLDIAQVAHVTVVDVDPDVHALVGAAMQRRYRDRLTLVEASAFDWQPPRGARWTVGWADIWDTISGAHWPQMKALRRRYGRRCDWWRAWCEATMRREALADGRIDRMVMRLAGAKIDRALARVCHTSEVFA